MVEWRVVRGVRIAVIENVLVVDLPGPRPPGGDRDGTRVRRRSPGGNSRSRALGEEGGAGKGDSGRAISLNEPQAFGAAGRRGGGRARRPVDQVLQRGAEDLDELEDGF